MTEHHGDDCTIDGANGTGAASAPGPLTLLFVDDEPNVLHSIRRMFRASPYQIMTAESGEEALALLERGPVDILVTDHRMTGMSGVELCRRVTEEHPFTVRLMLSGYADTAELLQALDEGLVFRMFNKPSDLRVLRKAIGRAAEQIRLIRCFQKMIDQLSRNGEKFIAQTEPTLGAIRIGFNGSGAIMTRERASNFLNCLFVGVESDSGLGITAMDLAREREEIKVKVEFGGCHHLTLKMALLAPGEDKEDEG